MSKQADRTACPSYAELEQFLADGGDSVPAVGGRTGIAPHLARCSRCREAVEEIRANNAMFDRIRESAVDAPSPSHEAAGGAGQGVPAVPGYEILGEVRRGGQGIVYRAVQQATNRPVALKVLLAGAFATSRQRRRFEREIELVAALEHRNIVTVYGGGVTDDGCPYLAMHYVEGVPLDEWVRTRREAACPLREVLELVSAICAGVNCAHQHGVIHRDLKPDNIIVDDDGEPRILDFGLARPIGEAGNRRGATVTVEGGFLGTIAYAAPEQTRGDPSLVDVRSDVYALGVIMYEMLTGRLPYPVDGDLAGVLRRIAEADPLPIRHRRGAGDRGWSVDDEMETIILKTLAKEKERRFQSVAALRDEIARYLAGEPIESKRDSGWYVLRKTLRRYRVQAATAAAFVLMLVTFSIGALVQNQRIRVEAEKLKQINLFLEDTLGSVESPRPGDDVVVGDVFDEAVLWIAIALADQPEVEASIRQTIGNGYRNLGLLGKAETQLDTAWRIRRELFGAKHVQVAQSMNSMALLRREQGRLDEAERLLRDALEMRRSLLGDDSQDVALSLGTLGLLRRDRGDLEEAERLLEESLAIRRRLFGSAHPDVAMSLFRLATVAERRGDLDEELRLHRETLEMRRAVLHRHHPDLARSLVATGSSLLRAGWAAEAEAHFRECLSVREETLPDGHWRRAATTVELGAALLALDQLDEAATALGDGREGLLTTLGPDDARTRRAEALLAELSDRRGTDAPSGAGSRGGR